MAGRRPRFVVLITQRKRTRDRDSGRRTLRTRPQPSIADDDLAAFIRHAIAASLAEGIPNIYGAATATGLSVRSLQRRLADAGLTYSQLREEVRREEAYRLIDDHDLSLSEIASALGYSDPAHFTRAFARWSGMTPRAYRQRLTRATPS